MLKPALLALFCLILAACATPVRHTNQPPSAGEAQRQILVTLRMPRNHYRPDTAYTGDYMTAPGRVSRRYEALDLARRYHMVVMNSWPIPALNLDCFVMQAAKGKIGSRLLHQLAADPRVASVQPMNLFRTLADSDPLSSLQPAVRNWHLTRLHERATGRHITIAEIDSGVQIDHPDLQGQIAMARNFVDDGGFRAESHGTEVAGLIVAQSNNGIGIVGVAPGARLLALRACWEPDRPGHTGALCSSFTLAKALQFALAAHVQVLNLSLAGPPDLLLTQLLDVALARGITIVAAADPKANDGGFPASLHGVLAVTGDHEKLRFASLLHAPSHDIPTTMLDNQWGFVSGSSFAAAQVSGLAAVFRQLSPTLQPAQLRAVLVARTTLRSSARWSNNGAQPMRSSSPSQTTSPATALHKASIPDHHGNERALCCVTQPR